MTSLPESVWGKLSLVLGALFLVSAVLQLNDPDPVPWIAMYAAAASSSAFAAYAFGTPGLRGARIAVAVVGLAALLWALVRAPTTLPHLTVTHLVESMKAETPAIEESRELFGLLLIALWNLVLFLGLGAKGGAGVTGRTSNARPGRVR